MVKHYIKFVMVFDNQVTAENVASWMRVNIPKSKLASKIGEGSVHVHKELSNRASDVGLRVVQSRARFVKSVDRQNVFDAVKKKLKESGVLSKLVRAEVYQHECTHDEAVPTPCRDELVYEYPSGG